MKKRSKWFIFLSMHFLFGIYSFGAVLSKVAANSPFPSILFFVCYTFVLFILAVYAFGWQQIIKHLPLTTAYANKAITVAWGILWGILFFGDTLSWGKALGALLIIIGIILWAYSEYHHKRTRGNNE